MLGSLVAGRYELTEKLGQDRWSHIYLAKDTQRMRQSDYVVKQFDRQSIQTTFDLFQEQVELWQQMATRCDRLPQRWSCCQENNLFYLIREYIPGRPLLDELFPDPVRGDSPLTEKQAIALLIELLEIVEFIHDHQVIHGQIHPNNIIRRTQDNRLVLIDFNPLPQINPKITDYQSPEQIQGNPTYSSDVYAVGMIIIQALTGIPAAKLPRKGQTQIIWSDKITVSRQLVSILTKMTSSQPKKRYFSTTKALTEVKLWQHRQHQWERTNYQGKRRKILWVLVGLLLAGSVTTFLLVNESALYLLLRPQVLLRHLSNQPSIPGDIELDIVTFNPDDRSPIVPDIAERVDRIAAEITVRIEGNKNNHGSGVTIGRNGNTYYVLTAKHIVKKPAEKWVVTPDGERHQLDNDSITKFPEVDLALLQFQSEANYSVATLGNYQFKYDRMPWVFLSGWPMGDNLNSPQREFNAGQVFSPEFGSLTVTDAGSLRLGYELIYTNFSKAGISGGPVFDTQGRAIGIHGASRVDRVSKVQLGNSLGVPIQRFLALAKVAGIPLEYFQVETSPPIELTAAKNSESQIPNVLSVNPPSQTQNDRHWVNYGNQLWRMGFNQAAVEAFDRAIQIRSDFYPAWYLRGLALKQAGKYSEALISFDRLIKLEPKFYQAWRERGEIFAQLGDYPQALKSIDRAIEVNDRDFVCYWLRGNWLFRSQRYVRAIDAYGDAISIQPHPFGYYNRGIARYRLQDYAGAISDFDRAIEIGFQSADIYQSRGLAHLARGDEKLAIKDLQTATDLFCQTENENCQKLQQILTTLTQ